VQMGRQHFYGVLAGVGLVAHLREGWQTRAPRGLYALKKITGKAKAVFASHALDARVRPASISGANGPTCQRLWYLVPARPHRRQLHRRVPDKGALTCPTAGHARWG
jgi:hypothetical protein